MVFFVSQPSISVCPLSVNIIASKGRPVRCPARVSLRTDPLPAVYSDLIGLFETHGLRLNLYADDSQIVGSCRPCDTVRNLGIHLDSDLSMNTHITRTVSEMFTKCSAVLRQIRSISRSVSQSVVQSLIVSLVHIYQVAEVESRRQLRSLATAALFVPATARSIFVDRAFSVAANRA